MATLTATEIERIRDLIGDDTPDTRGNDWYLSNTQIQAEWDSADGHASETNEYKAIYNMLRRIRGKLLKSIDTQTETGSNLQNQLLRNVEKALAEYKQLAGIGNFTMQTSSGVFDFGIDQDDPITGADLED